MPTSIRALVSTAALACVVLLPSASSAVVDRATVCDFKKIEASRKLLSCRLREEAGALLKGLSPIYYLCDEKFAGAWAKLEEKYGDECTVTGEVWDTFVMLTRFHERVRPKAYEVTFSIDTVSSEASDVVFQVHYHGMGYEIVGDGTDVQCENLVPSAQLALFFDGTQDGRMDVGWRTPTNDLTNGTPLVRCVVRVPESDTTPPVAEDFRFVVLEAKNASMEDVEVTLGVSSVLLE